MVMLLPADDVATALIGAENDVLNVVQQAYISHDGGHSDLPFSAFVRAHNSPGTRFIALPAYLGGVRPMAGVKWVSSFPDNVASGHQRASAMLLVSSLTDGYPMAILEGSRISAWRTAASAALASRMLRAGHPVHTVGLVGCGTIQREIIRFLSIVHPQLQTVLLFDAVPARAIGFAHAMAADAGHLEFSPITNLGRLLTASETVSIATTDSSYWLRLPDGRPPAQAVLHISLRDLAPETIRTHHNIVDDVEHVNREATSIALAAQEAGGTRFIDATLGGLLRAGSFRPDDQGTVFSPFGLGILDLAVADLVLARAGLRGLGTTVTGFDPPAHVVTGLDSAQPLSSVRS